VKQIIDSNDELKFIKRLRFYPLVLIVCYLWGSVNRIYVFFDDEIEWIVALHLFFGGLMGFLNSLVYGLNK